MAKKFKPHNRKRNPKFVTVHEEELLEKRTQRRTEAVFPKTQSQKAYDAALHSSRVTLGIGPAGVGKTWFAAMRASRALDRGEIQRIYVTRPIVEAEDEGLGFLPGELEEKYEPYLRPVKEAFLEYFGSGHLEYLLRKKIIEPRPLAFLRGATLKDCWVIADEMQNATVKQHKLLLSRIGENSRFIVNGDPSQCDIPVSNSGLLDACDRFEHHRDFSVVRFTRDEIVRDGIVRDVVEAYEAA